MYTGQQYGNNPNQVPYAAPKSSPGVPYPTHGAPYPTPGAPYPTPGAPYPTPGFNPQQQSSSRSSLAITLLKVVSLFLGLIAMSLALHGYFNANWFHETHITMLCENGGCKPLVRNSDQQCEDDINYGIRRNSNEKIRKLQLACPSRWLVIPEVFVITSVWVGTLVGLFILPVSTDVSKTKLIPLLDMIGHVVAGLLTIVSALCLLSFSLDVIVADNCDRIWKLSRLGQSLNIKVRKGGFPDPNRRSSPRSEQGGNSTIYQYPNYPEYENGEGRGDYFDKDEQLKMAEEKFKESCNKELTKKFLQWHIFAAGFFALLTGILYILIGVFARSGSKGGHTPILGQASVNPSQEPAQPQQTPSIPAVAPNAS